MPPFRLEALVHGPMEYRNNKKLLHCKKIYNEKVKITNWEEAAQSQCIEINPYDPKCYDLMKSHYRRLGIEDADWLTTNKEAYTNHFEDGTLEAPHVDKKFVNFFTLKENAKFNRNKICPEKTKEICGTFCLNDYLTTMQKDYEMPYPYAMKRLSTEGPPGNFKKMATHTECKFLDDNFVNYTKTLQDVKGFLHVDNTNNFEWK